jgi:hypothetical protein
MMPRKMSLARARDGARENAERSGDLIIDVQTASKRYARLTFTSRHSIKAVPASPTG